MTRPPLLRVLHAASLLVALVGVVRMVAVAGSSPLVALANNYDFVRVEACIGLWQRFPDAPKHQRYAARPVNHLVRDGDRVRESCLQSVDNVFPALVTRLHRMGSRVDFREIAALRVLFTLGLLGAAMWLAQGVRERLAIGAAFLLLFGDVTYLGYFNTLYTEFSVLAGGLFSALALGLLWAQRTRPGRALLALTAVSLSWLMLSKEQYAPAGTLLGLLAAAIVYRRWRWRAGAGLLLAIALVGTGGLRLLNFRHRQQLATLDLANKTNTYFQAVLPSATDKREALRRLGLPPACERGIGSNWYTPGLQDDHPCPKELAALSRLRLLPLFVADPPTFLAPVKTGIRVVRPFSPYDLGTLESPSTASAPWYRALRYSSLSVALETLSHGAFQAVLLGSVALGLASLAACLLALTLRRGAGLGSSCAPLLLGLGGCLVAYAVLSSVFGDGYTEVAKHAVGVGIGFSLQGAALLTLLGGALLRAGRVREPSGP